jgi:hypothetical protein
MRIRTPTLPDPRVIRDEIDALKFRIGELRSLLPLAEVQHLRKSLSDRGHDRKPAKAVTR